MELHLLQVVMARKSSPGQLMKAKDPSAAMPLMTGVLVVHGDNGLDRTEVTSQALSRSWVPGRASLRTKPMTEVLVLVLTGTFV